jgi:hypothetical protein
MRKLARFIMVCALTAHCAQAQPAATNESRCRLTIELRDGSRVVGKSLEDTLSFHSAVLGDLKLAWAGIRSIEYADANTGVARLTATNGDTFTIQFAVASLGLETSFGMTELPVKLIRSIRIPPMGKPGQTQPGLVGLWPGEGNGNDSAGGNPATLCGKATFAEGKIGQAFSFDGVDSFAKIPQAPSLNLTDQITISFWMKAGADNPMNTVQGLVASDFYIVEIDSQDGGWGVNFAVSTTANQRMDSSGHTTSVNFTHISQANGGGAPVTPDKWHHIAGTYDGTKLQLYVDGRPWGNSIRETGSIVPMLPKSYLAIGSEDGRTTCPECVANRYFKGLIDEVAIYNRALSAEEIQALCTEQNNGEPLPPPATPVPGMMRNGRFGAASFSYPTSN